VQAIPGQRLHRASRRGTRVLLLAVGSLARCTVTFDNGRNTLGHTDVIVEWHVVGVIDKQPQCFTNPPPGFFNRSPLRMTSLDGGNRRLPPSRVVACISHPVGLGPCHKISRYRLRSQCLPKQGSRSRSIARSVPGFKSSPACTGTVVRHFPHSTRRCEPTCLTSTHLIR
jgi:hypothetical protein